MSNRIEYPHIPDGAASPQLKNELRKLVDQINSALASLESTLGGRKNDEQKNR